MEIDTPTSTTPMSAIQAIITDIDADESASGRPVVFTNLMGGRAMLDQEKKKTFAKIQQSARRALSDEDAVNIVLSPTLDDDFRVVCEYLLVLAARHIFGDQPISCKAKQQGRVKYPLELFGIQRFMSISTNGAGGQQALFDEIHRKGGTADAGEDVSSIPPHLAGLAKLMMRTVHFTTQQYKHAVMDPDFDSAHVDPRSVLAFIAPMTDEIAYAKHPIILNEQTQYDCKGNPRRCAATNRLMVPGDVVRMYRMLLTRITNELGEAIRHDFIIEGVLDHGMLTDRQKERGATPSTSKRTVSELATRLLTFARVADWLRDEVKPLAQRSVDMGEGVVSSEVLSGQRQKNRGKKAASKTANTASVLKKNKPDEFEERVLAWHDFAYTPHGIRAILKLFESLKLMQIGFIRSYRDLGSILVNK